MERTGRACWPARHARHKSTHYLRLFKTNWRWRPKQSQKGADGWHFDPIPPALLLGFTEPHRIFFEASLPSFIRSDKSIGMFRILPCGAEKCRWLALMDWMDMHGRFSRVSFGIFFVDHRFPPNRKARLAFENVPRLFPLVPFKRATA